MPSRNAAYQIASIKAPLAQRCGGIATHLESVDAVSDDQPIFGQTVSPLIKSHWVEVLRTRQHIGAADEVFLKPDIEHNDVLLARHQIAAIVRAADNDNAAMTPEAAGLRAISFGLASSIRDDQARVAQGFVLYDALYRWAQKAEPIGRRERGIALWLARRRERIALTELDPWILRDIGVTPEEVAEECRKPFWRG